MKTLHPEVHAGILADRRIPAHERHPDEIDIEPFDLVVSQPVPLPRDRDLRRRAGRGRRADRHRGPSMVRAAAKNHAAVAIVTDPGYYPQVLPPSGRWFRPRARRRLAARAFAHTAPYDKAVAEPGPPQVLDEDAQLVARVRGPRAGAVGGAPLRREPAPAGRALRGRAAPAGIAQATPFHGKAMATTTSWTPTRRCARPSTSPSRPSPSSSTPTRAVWRWGADVADAHRKAHACDPVSAYGGVVAANRPVTMAMAEPLADSSPRWSSHRPSIRTPELLTRKKNVRLLDLPDGYGRYRAELRQVSGGVLVQTGPRPRDGDRRTRPHRR